jgi:hypothetical protein
MHFDWPATKCLVSSYPSYSIVSDEIFKQLLTEPLGLYEFVKKGDPPVVGITKLEGITLEELKRPRREIPLSSLPTDSTSTASSTTVSASLSPNA